MFVGDSEIEGQGGYISLLKIIIKKNNEDFDNF